MKFHRLWEANPRERFWLEITDRTEFDPDLAAASRMALEPTVRFESDLVFVNIHTSSSFSGLQRTTFSISRDFPHTIVEESTETLVEYFCGVVP